MQGLNEVVPSPLGQKGIVFFWEGGRFPLVPCVVPLIPCGGAPLLLCEVPLVTCEALGRGQALDGTETWPADHP